MGIRAGVDIAECGPVHELNKKLQELYNDGWENALQKQTFPREALPERRQANWLRMQLEAVDNSGL